MPTTTTLSDAALAPFLAQIERETEGRRSSHEAEARRQAFSGYGVDLGPFVAPTKAEKRAEARARLIRFHEPDAVLKRAVIAAANACSDEAERIYAAACRGDAGWQDRALDLLTQARAA